MRLRSSTLRQLKPCLQRVGLYPWARTVYRSLDSHHRTERYLRRKFFAQLVAQDDLCFDIGANVGQTIEALVHQGARVVALEPNPNCLPALRHQFGRNDRVTIVSKAVGQAPGVGRLHFQGTSATASLRPNWTASDDQVVDVEITTLKELMETYGAPRLLKVDVEGFEVEVFKALERPVPIIYFEMHASELGMCSRSLTGCAK